MNKKKWTWVFVVCICLIIIFFSLYKSIPRTTASETENSNSDNTFQAVLPTTNAEAVLALYKYLLFQQQFFDEEDAAARIGTDTEKFAASDSKTRSDTSGSKEKSGASDSDIRSDTPDSDETPADSDKTPIDPGTDSNDETPDPVPADLPAENTVEDGFYHVNFVSIADGQSGVEIESLSTVERVKESDGSYTINTTEIDPPDDQSEWLLSEGKYVLHLKESDPVPYISQSNTKLLSVRKDSATLYQSLNQQVTIEASDHSFELPIQVESEDAQIIHPEKGTRALILPAQDAKITGSNIAITTKTATPFISGWVNTADYATWDVLMAAPAKFDVRAVAGTQRGGGTLELYVDGQLVLSSELPKTSGGWNKGDDIDLGSFELSSSSGTIAPASRKVMIKRTSPASDPKRDFDYAPNIYQITLTP